MLAGLEQRYGVLDVLACATTEDDGIDVIGPGQLSVGERSHVWPQFGGYLGRALGRGAGDGDELGSLLTRDVVRVHQSDIAEARYRDAHAAVGRHRDDRS